MSRPLGLLVCGGRRRGGVTVSGLSLVEGGTITKVEGRGGETSLGRGWGCSSHSQHAFVPELGGDGQVWGWETNVWRLKHGLQTQLCP